MMTDFRTEVPVYWRGTFHRHHTQWNCWQTQRQTDDNCG